MKRDPWFTRGWTLQELLAPPKIRFFEQSWQPIPPNKNDKIPDVKDIPLWKTIEEITGISESQLFAFKSGTDNVTQIMVWASKRETRRVEDIAYCLIGMFDIPLSIAYGEGRRAFYRLQVELMQHTNDKGLFAWRGKPSLQSSMFAAGPECFTTTWGPLVTKGLPDPTHTVTNCGLRIPLSIYDWDGRRKLEDGKVQVRGVVTVVGPVPVTTEGLKVAILGFTAPGKALGIFLDCCEALYKRVATECTIEIQDLQPGNDPKIISIK
jgi:hypothetical protein